MPAQIITREFNNADGTSFSRYQTNIAETVSVVLEFELTSIITNRNGNLLTHDPVNDEVFSLKEWSSEGFEIGQTVLVKLFDSSNAPTSQFVANVLDVDTNICTFDTFQMPPAGGFVDIQVTNSIDYGTAKLTASHRTNADNNLISLVAGTSCIRLFVS